jgi:hypothetical protein
MKELGNWLTEILAYYASRPYHEVGATKKEYGHLCVFYVYAQRMRLHFFYMNLVVYHC